MYKFYELALKEKGLKNSDVVKGTGISSSTFTDWKKGRYEPKADKMQKIADFLGVSVEYLMTGEQKEYYIDPETAKVAQEIFENKELRLLFDAAIDAKPEDLATTRAMLMALKRKEMGDIDDTGC